MTIKNVKSGFHGAGLIPYNPAAVLRRLPSRPLTPPPPCAPTEFLTLKDMAHLQLSIEQRDKLAETGISEDLEALRKIQAKIDKATTTAFADRTILQRREEELLAHNKRKQAAASKKRKRVDLGQNKTVGEVNDGLRQAEAPHVPSRKVPTTRATRRHRHKTTPEPSEDGFESIDADEDSDVNSVIICAGAL
jgi:hypothetical protein